MLLPSQVDPEGFNTPPVLVSVPDVYDVDLDAEGEWDLSDTLVVSGGIEVVRCFLAELESALVYGRTSL